MKWNLYIVKCKDGSLYTGITNNVERRIKIHNMGKGAKYIVKSKRPAVLIYQELFPNKSLAASREIEIKGWSRQKKLRLIENQFDITKDASLKI